MVAVKLLIEAAVKAAKLKILNEKLLDSIVGGDENAASFRRGSRAAKGIRL